MEYSIMYETIFNRKSIRKYKSEPLKVEILEYINTQIKSLEPLDSSIKTEIVLLDKNDIKIIFPIKALNYLTIYSETKEGYLQNAGYLLQQMDLLLSSKEIGTCWLGLGNPQKTVSEHNGLPFVITMAVGYADEQIHRERKEEFKRKSLEEISSVKGMDDLLEAARVAPSASNSQPWYFSGDETKIIVYRKLPSILKARLYNEMNQIDMGIALCHIYVAALKMGKTINFMKEQVDAPKGYEYITTINL